MTNAARVEEAAARWLLRQADEEWNAADQIALDAWLEESPEHKVAYWRMEIGWKKAGRMTALRAPDLPPEAVNDQSPLRRWWPAAAAALLALAIFPAVMVARHDGAETSKTYATEIGGHESVPLADGSKLELNTQTQVRANLGGLRREVWLDHGEAYFEVAHDTAHPFIVHAGPKTVTVLGTKFSVRRDGDRVEVAVVEGRVSVEDTVRPAATIARLPILTRGDMVVALGNSTMLSAKSVDAVSGDLAWRDGMLSFDQVTLADAASEFNRYNRKKLLVVGEAGQMRIGGSFQAENVDVFARLLQRTYGLKIVDSGDTVKISQ